MGTETERKYVINTDQFPKEHPVCIKQGFISTNKSRVVRVRIADEKASLTIKSGGNALTRREFEYSIPLKEAIELLDEVCLQPVIDKTRYTTNHKGLTWEVDVFHGQNEGLIVAEVELENENQEFEVPSWVKKEVTGDERYYNVNLVKRPFTRW